MSDRKPYIVQEGHALRAFRTLHPAGATVELTDADAERLLPRGIIAPAEASKPARRGRAAAADAATDAGAGE